MTARKLTRPRNPEEGARYTDTQGEQTRPLDQEGQMAPGNTPQPTDEEIRFQTEGPPFVTVRESN